MLNYKLNSHIVWSLVLICFQSNLLVLCQPGICSDCTSVTDCPPVVEILNQYSVSSEDKERLRSAKCGGYAGFNPSICCLDFHPNLSLLPTECGFIDANRIVGGKETGLWEYPWMTLISYETSGGLMFKCGGTIINERYILTAAHCLKDQRIAGVRIGEHDIRTDTDCQKGPSKVDCEDRLQDIRVEKIIIHPKYQGRPVVNNDIGLLRLAKPVVYAKNAQPICLPVTTLLRDRDTANLNSTIAGWGVTEDGYSSPVLLSAAVPIYSDINCKEKYNRGKGQSVDETKNKFCAGGKGKDSCGGDSGGPLMLQGIHRNVDRLVQYGIVSYGPRLCGSDFPGVYTDVTKFMKWILDNIKP